MMKINIFRYCLLLSLCCFSVVKAEKKVVQVFASTKSKKNKKIKGFVKKKRKKRSRGSRFF